MSLNLLNYVFFVINIKFIKFLNIVAVLDILFLFWKYKRYQTAQKHKSTTKHKMNSFFIKISSYPFSNFIYNFIIVIKLVFGNCNSLFRELYPILA